MESLKRKVLIGGNWKCNGDQGFIKAFTSELDQFKVEDSSKAEVMVFTPSIHLCLLKRSFHI